MKTPTATYTVDLPPQQMTVNLLTVEVIDPPPPCDILGDTTDCNPIPGAGNILKTIADVLGIAEGQVPFILVGAAIAGIGIAIAMKGGKKRA